MAEENCQKSHVLSDELFSARSSRRRSLLVGLREPETTFWTHSQASYFRINSPRKVAFGCLVVVSIGLVIFLLLRQYSGQQMRKRPNWIVLGASIALIILVLNYLGDIFYFSLTVVIPVLGKHSLVQFGHLFTLSLCSRSTSRLLSKTQYQKQIIWTGRITRHQIYAHGNFTRSTGHIA